VLRQCRLHIAGSQCDALHLHRPPGWRPCARSRCARADAASPHGTRSLPAAALTLACSACRPWLLQLLVRISTASNCDMTLQPALSACQTSSSSVECCGAAALVLGCESSCTVSSRVGRTQLRKAHSTRVSATARASRRTTRCERSATSIPQSSMLATQQFSCIACTHQSADLRLFPGILPHAVAARLYGAVRWHGHYRQRVPGRASTTSTWRCSSSAFCTHDAGADSTRHGAYVEQRIMHALPAMRSWSLPRRCQHREHC
jgi:hypothetical protein